MSGRERSRNPPRNAGAVPLTKLSRRAFVKLGIGGTVGIELLSVNRLFGQTLPTIKPCDYRAPQSTLDDLKRRLTATHWTEHETVNDQSQGVPLKEMRALVDYWRDKYDWRRAEASLNRFPQFRTDLDGLGIHFIHAR